VALTAEREIEERGYHFKSQALRNYNRGDGRVRWSIPVSGMPVDVAASERFLAVIDQLKTYDSTGSKELLVLNPRTGSVLSRLRGEFGDLLLSGDSLTVIEDASRPGGDRLYTCTLPECRRNAGVRLSAKEILRFQIYQDYVLTWGIYDAACFSRLTGKRLWEKGQIEWSSPSKNEMIAADYQSKKQIARIISIDLQSGAERVLFARRVAKEDNAAFRW